MSRRRRRQRHEFDWRKPRYYRSDPLRHVKKISEGEMDGSFHGPISENKATAWQPISEKTFEYLKERGLLSPQQIENAEHRLGISKGSVKKRKSRAKDPNEDLIRQIAAIDLLTPEGVRAFKKIVDARPDALDLVAKATKLRKKLLAG